MRGFAMTLAAAIDRAVAERGYESASAFMRHTSRRTSSRRERSGRSGRAHRSRIESPGELRSLYTAQLATFAYVDALTKVLLTCIAEPPNDVIDWAKARAKRRYQKFLL